MTNIENQEACEDYNETLLATETISADFALPALNPAEINMYLAAHSVQFAVDDETTQPALNDLSEFFCFQNFDEIDNIVEQN